MTDDYFAGLFDGEGCIYLLPPPASRLIVSIGGAYESTIRALQAQYGGAVSPQRPSAPGNKQMWKWHLAHEASVAFLDRMRPLLREKRVQAWLALEFDAQRTVNEHIPTPPSERALRYGFHLALREAKRG